MNRAIMMRKNRILIMMLCGLMGSGCAVKRSDMRTYSTTTIADIDDTVAVPKSQVEVLDGSETAGRFPCGIAVARVNRTPAQQPDQATLELIPLKSNEATFWSELFDGTPEVREVVTIHENSVRDPYIQLQELLDAAKVLNTSLLLVFGYDNTTNTRQCTVGGVLYEVPSGKPILVLRHISTVEEAREEAKRLQEFAQPEDDKDLLFYRDHIAFRGFEKVFRNEVWHLIDIDHTRTELQPNPKPDYPRMWWLFRR